MWWFHLINFSIWTPKSWLSSDVIACLYNGQKSNTSAGTSGRKLTAPTSIQAAIVSKLFHWTALAVGGCTFPAVCARSVWLFVLKFKQDHSCDPLQSGGPCSVFTNHSLCLKGCCDKCIGEAGHSTCRRREQQEARNPGPTSLFPLWPRVNLCAAGSHLVISRLPSVTATRLHCKQSIAARKGLGHI